MPSAFFHLNWSLPEKTYYIMLFSVFFLLEETFDRVPFTKGFLAKGHAEFEQAGIQPGRAINEGFSIVDGVFVFQFSLTFWFAVSGWIEPYV